MNQLISSNQQNQIKVRIQTLEQELTGSQKKTERMCDVLENTRTHYSQLENKYDMARKLLKDYQERFFFVFVKQIFLIEIFAGKKNFLNERRHNLYKSVKKTPITVFSSNS